MKTKTVIGAVVGVAAGAAAAILGKAAVDKVKKEIQSEMGEQCFVSPEGDNMVTVSYGSSKTARGLTYLRVTATAESADDSCKLILFTRKMPESFDTQWEDNDHFKLLVGNGKRKQCCDISFDGDSLIARYYLGKDSRGWLQVTP